LGRKPPDPLDVEGAECVAEEDPGGVVAVLPRGVVDALADLDETLFRLRREVLKGEFETLLRRRAPRVDVGHGDDTGGVRILEEGTEPEPGAECIPARSWVLQSFELGLEPESLVHEGVTHAKQEVGASLLKRLRPLRLLREEREELLGDPSSLPGPDVAELCQEVPEPDAVAVDEELELLGVVGDLRPVDPLGGEGVDGPLGGLVLRRLGQELEEEAK
jgi:hypothetical protein